MQFEVTLIRVPKTLSAEQQRSLDVNCRHVEGPWWIMEGDPGYLPMRVGEFATGVTSGLHPDDVPVGQPIIDHAVDIFGLTSWPPSRATADA